MTNISKQIKTYSKNKIKQIDNTWKTVYDFIGNIKLSHLFSFFIFCLIFLIIINNLFSLSSNYIINEKISQISQIEKIKKDFNIDTDSIKVLEKEIYENNTIFTKNNIIKSYNKWISFIPKNNIEDKNSIIKNNNFISYFLSIEFLWILMGFFGIVMIFTNKKEKQKKYAFWFIVSSVIAWFIWYYLFIFINWLFWTQNIWWNIFYNSLLIILLAYIWNNKNNLKNNDNKNV
jgi:hypothetical protein